MARRTIHGRVFTTWNGGSMGGLRLMAFWPPVKPIGAAKSSMFGETPKGERVRVFKSRCRYQLTVGDLS